MLIPFKDGIWVCDFCMKTGSDNAVMSREHLISLHKQRNPGSAGMRMQRRPFLSARWSRWGISYWVLYSYSHGSFLTSRSRRSKRKAEMEPRLTEYQNKAITDTLYRLVAEQGRLPDELPAFHRALIEECLTMNANTDHVVLM